MTEKILRTKYNGEMQRSYINYSMSVIIARVAPDARDGLKPIQHRVFYDMSELRLDYDRPHGKSVYIVGNIVGKCHPHGDSPIYETLVVMSQDFKKGVVLVGGHGNLGSIEGGGAVTVEYTEVCLKKFTQGVYLKDLDRTASLVPNYDETEKEPEILPVRVPNLLINGAEGIAVGTGTNIPSHNLGEVVGAVEAHIDDPEILTEQLMEYTLGPGFPAGGIITDKNELLGIYENGAGKIKLRDRFEVEPGKRKAGRNKLVVIKAPYTVIGAGINKMLVDTMDLVKNKKLTDVVDISNQSNKDGIRIVLELCEDADIDRIKNILYKKAKLEDTLGVNMLAIAGERPETLNLRGTLRNFLNFQHGNTEREYNVLLQKKLDKKEVQEGLITARDCIGLIIAVLGGAKNLKDAKACLMPGDVSKTQFKVLGLEEDAKQLHFTEHQAPTILETRLYKLVGLEILALEKEHKETLRKIVKHKKILGGRDKMSRVIKDSLAAIRKEFPVPRRTLTEDGPEAFYGETAVVVQEVVFVPDRSGCCKLFDKSTYKRNQETVDIEQVHVIRCLNTNKICLFASSGSLHQTKVADVPARELRNKETPIENLSEYGGMKDLIMCLTNAQDLKGRALVFATKMAMVKQMPAGEFETNNHMVAVTESQEGDGVVTIVPIEEQSEVVLQTTGGVFLRFSLEEISVLKKASRGVRGIKLAKNEELKNLYLIGEDPVTEYGGKEVHMNCLEIAKRDGKGSKVRL